MFLDQSLSYNSSKLATVFQYLNPSESEKPVYKCPYKMIDLARDNPLEILSSVWASSPNISVKMSLVSSVSVYYL